MEKIWVIQNKIFVQPYLRVLCWNLARYSDKELRSIVCRIKRFFFTLMRLIKDQSGLKEQ
jgi:hypothetical protein